MFNIAKYYLLVNLYRRAKKNIMTVLASAFIMIVISDLFADLIEMMDGSNYGLVAVKWFILLLLMAVIIFNFLRMVKVLSSPFSKESKEPVLDVKKEKIMTKEHLLSRSDQILSKYRNAL